MNIVIGAVILWVIPIFVAVSIGRSKRRSGFLYGFLLGWIGVLILALLPATAELSPTDQLLRLRANPGSHSQKSFDTEHARLVALIDETARGPCPFCKESMRLDATICPHCRSAVEAVPT